MKIKVNQSKNDSKGCKVPVWFGSIEPIDHETGPDGGVCIRVGKNNPDIDWEQTRAYHHHKWEMKKEAKNVR